MSIISSDRFTARRKSAEEQKKSMTEAPAQKPAAENPSGRKYKAKVGEEYRPTVITEELKAKIYVDYRDKIARYVHSKIAEDSMVEDMVADVFVKIYENIDRYDPEKAALSTWIYTITSRTVMDHYRTRKVFSELPSENGEEGVMPEALIDRGSLDADLIEEEDLEELADALEKLPERERDLIILHYYSNMTLKEIAERMDMSYANIKIIHKKALNHMKGWLG